MSARTLTFKSSTLVRQLAAPASMKRMGFALAAGCALFAVLTLPKLLQVWSTGIFLNPDDAMRIVEVRDFMAGQGWFDLVPHRLSPDHPFQMHWSRLIDAPLALLVWLFGLAMSPANAELTMRLVAPALLFIVSLALMLTIVRDLVGDRAMLPAALLLAGSVEFVSNFLPGHIHHHAAQATLLLAVSKLTLDCVRGQGRWRSGALAGSLAALSLGIGLQNLPFMVGIATILALNWVGRGGVGESGLVGYGGGLAGGATAAFLLDVPPILYTQGACDAFSAAHLVAALLGGAGLLLLPVVTRDRLSRPTRFVALVGIAIATLGGVAVFFPACLGDPMAGVDPLLRERWLSDVGEALPLPSLIGRDPAGGLALALTLAVGFSATVLACRASSATARGPWLALLLLSAIGIAGTLYQVRVAASACAFLVPGTAWLVLRSFDAVAVRPNRPALLVAILVGLIGNGAGLTALAAQSAHVVGRHPADPVQAVRVDPTACFEPSAYTALAALPEGLVLSTIDPGSSILAHTSHRVLAAPYHRNSYGNRVALLSLEAPPTIAMSLIAEAHADYVVLCRFSNETAETVRLHPDSLSARLMSGVPPPGLSQIGDANNTMLIFRMDRRN